MTADADSFDALKRIWYELYYAQQSWGVMAAIGQCADIINRTKPFHSHFFGMSQLNAQNDAVIRLCKVYDTDERSASFLNLEKKLSLNEAINKKIYEIKNGDSFDLIKNFRNKRVAHYDFNINQELAERLKDLPSYEDFQKLIKESLKICEDIYKLYFHQINPGLPIIGHCGRLLSIGTICDLYGIDGSEMDSLFKF
jgi:hypothetical protein